MTMIRLALTILDFGMILLMIYMVYESYYEHESQATLISLLGVAFHIAFLYVILYIPGSQIVPLGYFGLLGAVWLIFLIPRKPNITALKGIRGDVIGDAPDRMSGTM